MTQAPDAAPAGLLGSLKTLSIGLVGIAHTRLELLSTDIAEEREHLITLLLLVQVALFFTGLGVLLLAILVVGAFWDSHRLLAVGALATLFLAAGAATAWFARHKTRTRPRLFEASLTELSRDRQHLGAEP